MSVKNALKYMAGGAILGGGIGATAGLIGGPLEIVTWFPGLIIGAGAGGLGGAIMGALTQDRDTSYAEMEGTKVGRSANPELASDIQHEQEESSTKYRDMVTQSRGGLRAR